MDAAHSYCFSLNVLFVGLIGFLLATVHLPLHVLCTASFSMELMHGDHPESPLTTPPPQLPALTTSIARSDSRNHSSPLDLNNPHGRLDNSKKVFVFNARIGAGNKTVVLVMAPTGLTWVKCIPCLNCYGSTQSNFHQRRSKSYHKVKCNAEECRRARGRCDDDNNCETIEDYGYGRRAVSTVSYEKIQLPSHHGKVNLYNITFGCTHTTEGHFHEDSIGIIGIGPGPVSFVSQLERHSYKRKISYCLPSLVNRSSTVFFGSSANVSGPGVVSTPIDISTNSYRVTVVSITVTDVQLQPLIIGTMFELDPTYYYTYMDEPVLTDLIEALKDRAHFPSITPARVDSIHKLCFDISAGRNDSNLPKITFNLAGDAPFVLWAINAFELVGTDAMCLTILPNKDVRGISILGSHAQLKKRIGIDLEDNTLSFKWEAIC